MRYLTFALTKGRLANKSLALLEKIGITCEEIYDKESRKLIFVNDELKLKIVDTKYIKGIFNTTSAINRTSTIINGIEHEFTYLPTDFTVTIAPERDYNNAPLIRRDYYSNLEFTPIVKNKVRFGRGNSSAWERHIKLGEVKSFDDFLNYQNNGFFNVI
jgi:hypothetical protein